MALLISLADMKAHLDLTVSTYDDFLTAQLTIVSDAVEGYCGRKLLTDSYTQTFYGMDSDAEKLNLYHYPVTAVASVKEILNSDETALTTDEFLLNPTEGFLRRTTTLSHRQSWFTIYGLDSKVEVAYTAGYATTPTPIEDVVYTLVSERYNKKISGIDVNFGNDIQRLSIPGVMSIDFDYTLQANERKSAYGMILGNYSNILDMYRSERRLIGEIRENYVE